MRMNDATGAPVSLSPAYQEIILVLFTILLALSMVPAKPWTTARRHMLVSPSTKPAEAADRTSRMDRGSPQLRDQLADSNEPSTTFKVDRIPAQGRGVAILWPYQLVGIILILLVILQVVYRRRMLSKVAKVNDLQRREVELQRANVALENATIGIAFVDTSGRYSFVNGVFAATLGYSKEELVGLPFALTVHAGDLQMIVQAYADRRENAKSEHEIRAACKGSETVEVRVVIVPSHDEHGAFLGHYCFQTDVTEQNRAQSALRRSEERFHLAAKATSHIVFEWDLKTNACWCNEAVEEQFGFTTSGDVDLSLWLQALHPGDRDRVMGGMQATIRAGGQFWAGEYRFRRGNGVYADTLTHAYIVRDPTGKPLRVIGALMDISERKRAERSYNTQILNAAADGIFGVDAEGLTAFANESAARLLGWRVEDLLGKNIHDLAHDNSAEGSSYPWTARLARKTLQTGDSARSDQEVFRRRDGSSFACEYEVTAIRDGEGRVTGAVITFRDISERRVVERMKSEFVSVVSHELRTPLTSIRGALGLMAGGLVGEIPGKAKRMLEIAVSNTDRLVRLVNDILDFERMESGEAVLSRQWCNAHDLMSQAIELLKPVADKAGVAIECRSCDAPLFADSDRLLQTFTNLLSNAVKFSAPAATVSLSATLEVGVVRFEVADHGRGIPADKLELIFERFQQVDASDSRDKGGTGLGLPICRSIVRQHGGEIWAESEFGQGSRFFFTIPRTAAAVVSTSLEGAHCEE